MKTKIGFLVFVALISGCNPNDKKVSGDKINPDAAPPAAIEDSFSTKPTNDKDSGLGADSAHVVVKKAALDKEFLLSTSLVRQLPAQQFSFLEPMIVKFILRDGKVYLLNATAVQQIESHDKINALPLAEFPILSQNKDQIEIDFNAGTKLLFRGTSELVADDVMQNYGQSADIVNLSYLDEVTLKDDTFFIRQVAQLKRGNLNMPVEVRYHLRPYLPDSTYKPIEIAPSQKVGFFETETIFVDGYESKFANRWHPKKKIRFAISANTPEEMRPFIRDGLLYWNRAFGEQKIEVVQLEDKSIRAPQPNMNIVQWVDWESLGTAYADFDIDPRTGEILKGNIFLPSGKHEVIYYDQKRDLYFQFGLRGFKPSQNAAVNVNLSPDFINFSTKVASHISHNYIEWTVAHEMGHVLGLKHNFAGSLGASYDAKDLRDILKKYYETLQPPDGVKVSNSVMDYVKPHERSMAVDALRKSSEALSYDSIAIGNLYLGRPLPESDLPPYCTNGDESKFFDCIPYDSGKSAIAYVIQSYKEATDDISVRLLRLYLPSATRTAKPNEVNANSVNFGNFVYTEMGSMMSLFKKPQFLGIRTAYFPIINTEKDKVEAEEKAYVETEIARLGGLESILKPAPDFEVNLIEKFNLLAANENLLERAFPSSTDRALIQSQVQQSAAQISEKVVLAHLLAFSELPDEEKWAKGELSFSLARAFNEFFVEYALAKLPESIEATIYYTDGTEKKVALPRYRYSDEIRKKAANIFSGSSEAVEWAFAEKASSKALIQEELKLVADGVKTIDMAKLSPEVAHWIIFNKSL